MRALLRVADQPSAIERGGGGNPVGIARSSSERVRTAHAIAVSARGSRLYLALAADMVKHRADVLHDRRDRHPGAHRAHAITLRTALIEHIGPEDRVAPGSVIEVGQ